MQGNSFDMDFSPSKATECGKLKHCGDILIFNTLPKALLKSQQENAEHGIKNPLLFHSTTGSVLESKHGSKAPLHGVQRRTISVDNFFVFLRLLFFAVLLLYVTLCMMWVLYFNFLMC